MVSTPALAYASDCHLTDVISVMSRQSHVMSAVCLSYRSVISEHSRKFYLDYNRVILIRMILLIII